MANILVVDDDIQSLIQVREYLKQHNHNIGILSKPQLVFKRLQTEAFDIILLDIHMPEVDGVEILKSIKSDSDYHKIPVIMLTGDTDELVMAQCLEIGAVDFITKPVSEIVLRARITSAITTQGHIRQLEEFNDKLHQEMEERQRLEKRLRQSQKMEALGTLAGGIAHEFNNLLFAILGYAELLSEELHSKNISIENIEPILKAGQRARDLVKQILTFSRQRDFKRETVQIIPLLKEAVKLFQATLSKSVELNLTLEVQNIHLAADPTQIYQVIVNLCANAGYAMRDTGGKLNIVVTRRELNETEAQFYSVAPGVFLEIKVQDTGCGMPPKVLERIFDPFFTTKPVGEGTGMGLAIVHGIIKNHDGVIYAESTPEVGSTFHVLLPGMEVGQEVPLQPTQVALGGEECILLVDDEEFLLQMQRQMLQRLGYLVKTALDGKEALAMVKANPGQFDLVITDQAMPNMIGTSLAKELLKLRPDLPVILITGYHETLSPNTLQLENIKDVILKPIELNLLSNLVYNVLHENTKNLPPHK